ncbi:MAG: glycosyltransferase family 39 protein [Halobacteria archaeon]|nr:glycosyltransferase family 39 protein [Halobacteria archaeon]
MEVERQTLLTALVAVIGGIVVWTVSTDVFAYHSLNHDEGVYLHHASMLLDGNLRLKPPVDGVFRPWFFVEGDDGLYPKYSPVPAVIFGLGELLGGYRLSLIGVSVGVLVLVSATVREAFDSVTGVLAAVFVGASPLFIVDASVFLPYAPTTLLNLVFAYSYLRADRLNDLRWASLAGVGVGLSFFARPYTAVLFAAPFIAHAVYTVYDEPRVAVPRQTATAVLGLSGVAATVAYNAVMTGSPLGFPYLEFAPLDGIGFGRRRILSHEIVYTPELALRSNYEAVRLFFTDWIAGGVLGGLLAVVGLLVAFDDGIDRRKATVAGIFVSVIAGNLYFWGNFNILGDLDAAGDGLVSFFGPYYHFDLLVPTAAFASAGAVALYRRLRTGVSTRGVTAVVILSAAVFGGVTAVEAEEKITRNAEVTRTYSDVYEPFEETSFENAVVFLPDPYGNWLAHPFQYLRNSPDYDGDAIYVIDDRPFDVVDEYPDRTLYRYSYRGVWSPADGSPETARLEEIEHVEGSRLSLDATLGIPDPDEDDEITATVTTDEGTEFVTFPDASGSESVNLSLGVTRDKVRLRSVSGSGSTQNVSVRLGDSSTVEVVVFVDQGFGNSFEYRLSLPVESATGVRGLTPRKKYCDDVRLCDGYGGAYIPESSPEGVFVRTDLHAETEGGV